MRLASLSFVYLLLLTPLSLRSRAAAQGPATVTHRAGADSCLSPSEFQLQGIDLHADALSAASTLGHPTRTRTSTGADDGGRYEIQRYDYPALSMEVVRGMIDRLVTRSASTSTPSGLRPGLTFEAVRDLLATKGVVLRQFADTVDIGTCSPTEGIILEDYVTLIFNGRRYVQVLELSVARP